MINLNFIIDKYKQNITVAKKLHDGIQVKYKFDNGYTISFINHSYSYGNEAGIIKNDKESIDIEVIGYIQSQEELERILDEYSGKEKYMELLTDNAERLYKLIVEEDESLCGIQWENLYISEYDTPASIIKNFLDIYLNTDFEIFDDKTDEFVLISNKTERKLAIIKYLNKILNELEQNKYGH